MQITVRDPNSGDIIGTPQITSPAEAAQAINRARLAQKSWAEIPARQRVKKLLDLRETLVQHADVVAELISRENGKPKFEALVGEIMACANYISHFAKHGPRLLASRSIRIGTWLLPHRYSYIEHAPLGVVAIISPWNFPLLLPFVEIVMALVAGNAVVFKPSEVTPLTGLKIAELCRLAGLPEALVEVIVGDGSLGAELIRLKPNKIFFTGSVATGKKIMAAAAEHLIPVNLELGGKDAMIVCEDADLDLASSAAVWGSIFNLGQACASVERILVHEKIAPEFERLLVEKMTRLKRGSDLGAITFEKQKQIYQTHLEEAEKCGARFVTGGHFSADRRFLEPTVVTGPNVESLLIYNEETFGPVVAVTTFKSDNEAVQKANSSHYGLTDSIFSRDHRAAERLASRLEAGTITINETLYTAGIPGTPWGGWKNSGFGRTHHVGGLYEFTQLRHIHSHRTRFTARKSLWWFPYSKHQYDLFAAIVALQKRGIIRKTGAFWRMIKNLVLMLIREPRL